MTKTSSTIELPSFTYHPDPIATEAVVPSTEVCECCGEARGYVYCTSPYGLNEIECLCPWCIADGSANKKLGASFVDDYPLASAGVSQSAIEEVSLRTPGFISWQQEEWLSCCNDACEFHGDAPVEELRGLDEDGLRQLSMDTGFLIEDLREIVAYYVPKGSPAFYKFVCRHCGKVKYAGDCD